MATSTAHAARKTYDLLYVLELVLVPVVQALPWRAPGIGTTRQAGKSG
jgi:hypothetical protein